MPQAQDPMVFIGELVKALNLYSNPGVAQHSNMNNNSNAIVASKKFWLQKARFLMLLLSILCDHFLFVVVVFFFFSLFLGFALHNIYAFHFRYFLYKNFF